jgi:hypothetical protein
MMQNPSQAQTSGGAAIEQFLREPPGGHYRLPRLDPDVG